MDTNDLDDIVLGVIEVAYMEGRPLTYAVGPLSDRRIKQEFRARNLIAPMDRLCGSINRLAQMGVLRKVPTGAQMIGSGSCGTRPYDIVELEPI
ncbi:hypothetical protein RAAC3_TM7C00001G0383 [Candidatus Saccharibacteria bacterium RAAC3_TM7_1]|nr:hypothetical protein RAAC3_TM7C00001G0383 [Candidatus Saccharibacteria bacterium RAAC3_TM7_1]HCZ28730.1 hypothetical protein [Candidatus Saccharibacteria bacterium]